VLGIVDAWIIDADTVAGGMFGAAEHGVGSQNHIARVRQMFGTGCQANGYRNVYGFGLIGAELPTNSRSSVVAEKRRLSTSDLTRSAM